MSVLPCSAYRRIRRRTWLIAVRKKEPPGTAGGSCSCNRVAVLPAGLEADSATGALAGASAEDVTGGNKLDPKRTVAFVVRGGIGLTQCIQAALLRTCRCSGESRQLEHHPRTGIQFRHAEGHGRPFSGDLVLGARSYVGCTVGGEILPIAAENDWRTRRWRSPQGSISRADERTAATPAGSAASTAGR